MEVSCQFHILATLPTEKGHQYTLNTKLSEPQSQCGHFWKNQLLFSLLEFIHQIVQPMRLGTVLTMLLWPTLQFTYHTSRICTVTDCRGFKTLGHFFEIWIETRVFRQWEELSLLPTHVAYM